jgi:polysaccharide biosynthesis transport protein
VTPDALRHTYAAYLARQGIRLTDLARAVGSLSPDLAARYSAMAPPGKRLGLEQVQRVMPLLLAQPLLQPQSA